VRRIGRFIVHNWPLKIGAIGLAAILYGGMVILQSTAVWPGTVAITPVNYPADSTLPGPLPTVGNIRYVAPPDLSISVNSFRAQIDLTGVKPSESELSIVNVTLFAEDPRIQIIDYQPQQISVLLEPITTSTVPVVVDTGAVPSGLSPGTPITDPSTVTIRGASSEVRKVAYVVARVRIDNSGLDVNQDVTLVARDAANKDVNNVTIEPPSVHVAIQVGSQLRTQSVPVNPNIVNSPASGYRISGIEVTPPIVEVEGQADALASLKGVANTQPISVAGLTGDKTVIVGLALPSGVTGTGSGQIQVIIHVASPNSTLTVSAGIVPSGTKSDLIYLLSTPSVNVTIGGAAAALNAFDTSTLVGNVSVGGLGPGTYTVTVTFSLPAGIKVVPGGINPSQITVTITNPATPAPSSSGLPTASAVP
jgi:YbbR domain-containing protein